MNINFKSTIFFHWTKSRSCKGYDNSFLCNKFYGSQSKIRNCRCYDSVKYICSSIKQSGAIPYSQSDINVHSK